MPEPKRARDLPKAIEAQPAQPCEDELRTKAEGWVREHTAAVENCTGLDELDAVIAKGKAAVAKLDRDHADLREQVMDAYSAKGEALEAAIANVGQSDADDFEGEEA
jgi:hypothetical protein